MVKTKRPKFRVRSWNFDDIPDIVACHRAAYPEYAESAYYTERFYEMQFAAFPEGQFLAEADGEVIGYATSLIVQLDDEAHSYTYEEITGGGTFTTQLPLKLMVVSATAHEESACRSSPTSW